MINEAYAFTTKLNDLYFTACCEYTNYIQTGNIEFKDKAEEYFRVYKQRGGRKDKLKLV